jgi:hypothetical protein
VGNGFLVEATPPDATRAAFLYESLEWDISPLPAFELDQLFRRGKYGGRRHTGLAG